MRNAVYLVIALALAAGCGKKTEAAEGSPSADPGAAVDPSAPSPTEEARTTFKTICATCHGENGTGDGPGAAALNPKPRNYTDKAWQAKVTDDEIKKAILGGGGAVGLSPAMPAQTQLRDKPEVVEALVRIVRTFGN